MNILIATCGIFIGLIVGAAMYIGLVAALIIKTEGNEGDNTRRL